MTSKSLLLALSAVVLGASACAVDPADRAVARDQHIRRLPDIVYGRAGGHDLKLDLYLPVPSPARSKGTPVVLFFHGGGWRVGSKADGERFAQRFTDHGIALACVDYRLSAESIWPAQILDAKTAVRWVRANAGRYSLDPARIGGFGASAGGHLVALLGTTEGVQALEGRAEGSPHESSRVQAVCDVSGPVDMNISTENPIGKLAVRGEFGGSAQEKPAVIRQADPSLYVKGGEPPFLIIQGARDGLVLPAHAYKLQAALRAQHDEVSLDLVPDGGHVPLQGEKQQAEIVAFFQKHLG